MVVGGGLAGIAAALRLADAGATVTLAGGPPASRRRRVLVPAAAICRSTTASTSSCAAARPTAACCGAWAPRATSCCSTGWTSPCCTHPGGRARLSRLPRRPRAAAPLGGACPLPPADDRPTGCAQLPVRSRCAGSTRPIASLDARRWATFLRATPAERRDDRRAVGHRRHRDAQPAPGRGVAGARRQGVPHRTARPRARRQTSATPQCRSANCTRPRPRARWTLPASRCCSPTERARRARRVPGQRRTPGVATGRATAGRPTPSSSRCPTARRLPAAPALAATPAARPRRISARARSSTCTSSTTGRSPTLPFAAAVGSPVQWFFDRTDTSGLQGTGSTWRLPCRRPTRSSTSRAGPCRRDSSPSSADLLPGRARANGRRRVRDPRAARHVPPGRRQRGAAAARG